MERCTRQQEIRLLDHIWDQPSPSELTAADCVRLDLLVRRRATNRTAATNLGMDLDGTNLGMNEIRKMLEGLDELL